MLLLLLLLTSAPSAPPIGPPDHLAMTAAPTTASSGVAMAPQPAGIVLDAGGRLCTTGVGATQVVTVAVTGGSAVLSGPTTTTSVAGVFHFAGLTLTGPLSETVTLTYIGPGALAAINVPVAFTGSAPTGADPFGIVRGTAIPYRLRHSRLLGIILAAALL